MNIFEVDDYKKFLKSKTEESRGSLSLVAKHAQCQPSYLQRIIHEEAHLTMDQGYRLCELWMFDIIEKKYFLNLLTYQRASDVSYKKELKGELDQLKKQSNNLQRVVKSDEAAAAQFLMEYHGDFRTALIHFLTNCEKMQSANAICKRTNLDPDFISQTIQFLKEKDLITSKGATIKFSNGFGHIPSGSPILPIFLNNWRQYAVQKSLNQNNQSIHYTNIQSVALEDLQTLIEVAKSFIRKSKTICEESGADDIVCINLDVFLP